MADPQHARSQDPTHHQEIVESVGDGIISIDENQRIVVFNKGAERLFGYRADEILGRPLSILLPLWARADHQDLHVQRFARERTQRRDMGPRSGLTGCRKDGSTFPAEVTISKTHSVEAPVFTAIVRDISDRQRAGFELENPSAFVSAILATVTALVMVIDPEGRIEFFNRTCETTTGRRSGDVLGTPVWNLIAPDDRAGLRAAFQPLERVVPRYRSRFVTPDGSIRLVDWTNTTIRSGDGRIEHVIATGIDVTDQRRLEDQLVQASKMELVGRIAGGIAHDFNNILAVVKLRLDRLESRHADRRSRHDLQQMREALERATELISDMMSFSRQQRLELVGLDVNSEVESIADILDDLLGVDIELTLDLRADPAVVRADRNRLAQVIVNLAVNARDAMPEGGQLRVHTYNRTVEADPLLDAGVFVCTDVADTGVGMDAHTLAHAFEPFFSTRSEEGGTGLGLATIHGIVNQLGGNVDVNSQVGAGTTFTICLPAADLDTMAPAVDTATTPAVSQGGKTVLVVEDETELRTLIAEELERLGYRVLQAADAVGARQHDRSGIDLLLTDVVIPGVSGPALAVEFLDARPDLPVLFTTGYARGELPEALPEHTPLLSKPFSIIELGAAVRQALASGEGGSGGTAPMEGEPSER